MIKTITKTVWSMTHSDYKKVEKGSNFITGYDLNNKTSFWVQVKIKGVKQGETY